VFTPPKSLANDLLRLAGNSVVALLIALLVSFWTLGRARGFDRNTILKFTNECLGPIAAGDARRRRRRRIRPHPDGQWDLERRRRPRDGAHVSPLLLGWLVAALIRVATGSATVAMTTACGIVAPIVATAGDVSPS
jgi:GntP family gluconate:H+ symporter